MDKSKIQILSELYCIKAGLSAISMEKDKVTKEENKLKKLCKEITENNDNISRLRTLIATEERDVTLYQSNSYKSEKRPKFHHQISGAIWGAVIGAVLSPIGVIVVSFLIGLIAAALDKDTSASFAFMEHPIIFLYGLIGFTIVGIPVGMSASYFSKLKSYDADEENRQKMLSSNNQKISEHKKSLNGYETELTRCNYALEKNIPILGICVGMQMMCRIDQNRNSVCEDTTIKNNTKIILYMNNRFKRIYLKQD